MGQGRGRRQRLVLGPPGDGYVYVRVQSEKDPDDDLNGLGDAYAYVNGELRMGGKYAVKDTYESWEPRFDYGQVPDRLEKRGESFFVSLRPGAVESDLIVAGRAFLFNDRDVTLPTSSSARPSRPGRRSWS